MMLGAGISIAPLVHIVVICREKFCLYLCLSFLIFLGGCDHSNSPIVDGTSVDGTSSPSVVSTEPESSFEVDDEVEFGNELGGSIVGNPGNGSDVRIADQYCEESDRFCWCDLRLQMCIDEIFGPVTNYDADGDGNIDDADAGYLFSAYTGPENSLGREVDEKFDFDSDGDVDEDDIDMFFKVFTGPIY